MTSEQKEFNKICTKKLLKNGFNQLSTNTFLSSDFKITLDNEDKSKVFSILIRNINTGEKHNIIEFSSIKAYNMLDSFIITNCLEW